MDDNSNHEREVRAARNQSMFRALNEQLATLNDTFASVTGAFSIACECADATCIEMVRIAPDEYEAVRAEPRRFVVLPSHVYLDVEVVVAETSDLAVVEKLADVAEALATLTVSR